MEEMQKDYLEQSLPSAMDGMVSFRAASTRSQSEIHVKKRSET